MKIMFVISVVASFAVCLMVYLMSMLGLAEPNLSGGESLLMFYLTLFAYTFAAFPLTGIVISLTTIISRFVVTKI